MVLKGTSLLKHRQEVKLKTGDDQSFQNPMDNEQEQSTQKEVNAAFSLKFYPKSV